MKYEKDIHIRLGDNEYLLKVTSKLPETKLLTAVSSLVTMELKKGALVDTILNSEWYIENHKYTKLYPMNRNSK